MHLPNPQSYMQALGNQACALQPPAQLEIEQVAVEGMPVIVAEVRECDPSNKPCRIASSGLAFVRSHDGDYEISQLEEQAFLRLRSAPVADRQEVPGTSISDLDRSLVEKWRDTVRLRDPEGLGRFDNDEMLVRAGVTTRDGILTKAGLLALGSYPQQYFPRLVVHVADLRTAAVTERARNIQTFNGPIPVMLSETLTWLTRNMGTRAVESGDGSVRDVPEFPPTALRELIANALVHRDIDAWSEGRAIEIRLRPNRLEVTNPGGLYGITTDRLGTAEITSARNQRLISLCENVIDLSGARVVEALATGLATVARELASAVLPPARFFDTGIMFTVALTAPVAVATKTRAAEPTKLPKTGTNLRTVLDAVISHPNQSVEDLVRETNFTSSAVRTAITTLRGPTWNLVEASGGRGKKTTYAAIQHERSQS